MSKIEIGVNLEFIRSSDKGFRVGIETAAKLGYTYVEPCLSTGYDLLALAGYYHMVSMEEDPLEIKGWLDELGLKPSAVSAHSPLMRPEVAVPYLTKAIRYASVLGAPVVTTDEGVKPDWMSEQEAFDIMRYTIRQVMQVAERHAIKVGLEPHSPYTVRKETFLRILDLSDSPCWRVNWDTGNFYLAGKDDPYDALEAVADRLCHFHAKDIARKQADAQRGQVTGTPVGCACGDGDVDWPRVVDILKRHKFQGVMCVECGTVDQAARSLKCLQGLLGSS
jgi:sugar phosphate isomerase/epimerase